MALLLLLVMLSLLSFITALFCGKFEISATLLVGLITVGVIWWQGSLIKKQMQLNALIDLEKEWNSQEMCMARSKAFTDSPDTDDLEIVLEFLEKFAYFQKVKVLDRDLVWDSTLGWYAFRYYYYNEEKIPKIRNKWRDDLYVNLENLYTSYQDIEAKEKNKEVEKIKQDLNATKNDFLESEKKICKNKHLKKS